MLWQKIYDKLSSFRNNSIFFYDSTPPVDVDNMNCEKNIKINFPLHKVSSFAVWFWTKIRNDPMCIRIDLNSRSWMSSCWDRGMIRSIVSFLGERSWNFRAPSFSIGEKENRTAIPWAYTDSIKINRPGYSMRMY